MYSQKARIGVQLAEPVKNQLTPQRQRLRPFFLHMGPVSLCITSVVLIALMAILYLSQLGQAEAANQRLQSMRSEQTVLQRQDQDLQETIAQERSPAYVAVNAQKQGLVPADPKNVWELPVQNLQPLPKSDP